MKNYSINPTDENAIEMFRSDAIERNKEILRFINLLDAIDDCCAIALNGEWGSGKTFLIKQIKLILDFCNPYSDMTDETRVAVKSALPTPEYKCSNSYATVYYDAWANDNSEDPILSLIYTAIKNNQSDISPEKKKNISDIIAAIAEVVTGRAISTLHEKAKGVDFFVSLKKEDDIHKLVENFIDTLILERADRLVIFIDELDRCKPNYAIQLLERIKHYFDDERIIFVFSLNLSQLQHTVKGYYGAEFDAARYLDKFFDLRLSLPEINYDTYIYKRFGFMQTTFVYDKICIEVIKYFRLSLRETERFIRLVRIANRRDKHIGGFHDANAYHFTIMYFVPVIMGLSMTDIDAYTRFIKGVDSGPLCEILLNYEGKSNRGISLLLGEGECFSEKEKRKDTDVVISLKERINDVYAALFPKAPIQYQYTRNVDIIGQLECSPDVRKDVNKIISLLSPYSNYGFE